MKTLSAAKVGSIISAVTPLLLATKADSRSEYSFTRLSASNTAFCRHQADRQTDRQADRQAEQHEYVRTLSVVSSAV